MCDQRGEGNDGVGEGRKGSFETGRRHYVEKPQKGIYPQHFCGWLAISQIQPLCFIGITSYTQFGREKK
uniref:Uncharacterized protein n=1 Tax=Athene cunicularia TaxID=194338 RepID=A0A663M1I2_ATHCN